MDALRDALRRLHRLPGAFGEDYQRVHGVARMGRLHGHVHDDPHSVGGAISGDVAEVATGLLVSLRLRLFE